MLAIDFCRDFLSPLAILLKQENGDEDTSTYIMRLLPSTAIERMLLLLPGSLSTKTVLHTISADSLLPISILISLKSQYTENIE